MWVQGRVRDDDRADRRVPRETIKEATASLIPGDFLAIAESRETHFFDVRAGWFDDPVVEPDAGVLVPKEGHYFALRGSTSSIFKKTSRSRESREPRMGITTEISHPQAHDRTPRW
ncbi:hypothetical protein SAMN05444156_2329 [Verrucomicrobium sp. GAS474]|uniref:hypothetical protein n=1 Tax=Verrucomicrobium sp. GAS474 TaxID=1882831 RepID=UPI00087C3265|nr:hypothetical protein [Verrucomicrobium sp. GAS474]SDU16082.1 hypothetical protein SAMN05444156_2329 [Verrucomicrobium sp. GAS474]